MSRLADKLSKLALASARIAGLLWRLPWQFMALKRRAAGRFLISVRNLRPQIFDAVIQTPFDRHYVYHAGWACHVLAEAGPVARHVDISSSLYFVACASAIVPIEFLDYRPPDLVMDGVATRSADLMRLDMPDGSLMSVSCMHVLEHIGLGRYGDPFDPDGDLKAVEELKRVVSPGGRLLLVVPLAAVARIDFNAHRVYEYGQVLSMLGGFELVEFALIPDNGATGGLIRHADVALLAGQYYACGCFHFKKAAA
ncbi:MAG: DUF268 domain-containing protein [Acidobacteriota bacterium]